MNELYVRRLISFLLFLASLFCLARAEASLPDHRSAAFKLPATVDYAYDLNGNLTSDGALGYDYDDFKQLVRVTKTNAWKSEFSYDPLGRRNLRREYTWSSDLADWQLADEVRYVWLGMSVIQECDAANQVRVTYTGRLAREDAALGATSFYFTDGNRNVSSPVNDTGDIVARYRYDSFGNLLSQSGPLAEANLTRFSGKEYHPRSGLYYYGFRYYQPNLQRWLNQDPIGIAGGLNLYGFVGNDPIDLMDPYGLSPDDFFQCMADKVQGLNDLLGKGEEGLRQSMAALNDLNHAVNPMLADGFDYLNAKVSGMKSAASDYAGWVGRGAYDSMMGGASGQGSQYSKANLDAEAGLTSGVNDLARETAGVAAQMMFDGGMLLAEAAVTKKLGDLPGPGPKKGTPSCPVKPPNAAESGAFANYMRQARTLDVATAENGAVFYSGQGNRALAEQFATANGRTTLEMTPGGRWLDQQQLFGPNSPLTRDQAVQVWSTLSERFAAGASGNAVGFVNGARAGSIFNTVEYPALINNRNVVNVITGGH